jgi:hypothetical protein
MQAALLVHYVEGPIGPENMDFKIWISTSTAPRRPYPSLASSLLASLDVLLLGASVAAFFR